MYYNNKKLILSCFWVVLGIVLVILATTEVIKNEFYGGFGGGLIAVGILQIVNNIKYRKNSDYKNKVDIDSQDERNRFIRMKAWSWTGYTLVMVFGIATIVFAVMEKSEFAKLSSYLVCGTIGTYWIIYTILNRKY